MTQVLLYFAKVKKYICSNILILQNKLYWAKNYFKSQKKSRHGENIDIACI